MSRSKPEISDLACPLCPGMPLATDLDGDIAQCMKGHEWDLPHDSWAYFGVLLTELDQARIIIEQKDRLLSGGAR